MSTPSEQRAFEEAIKSFPVAINVCGNDSLEKALGPTRKRDMTVIGTVIDYDRDRCRLGINWTPSRHVEYLAPRYLDPVGG